jgi:hypothetical protein
MGGNANAIDAFRAQQGLAPVGADVTAANMANLGGGGRITGGMIGRDLLRIGTRGLLSGGGIAGAIGGALGSMLTGGTGGLEIGTAMQSPEDRAASSLAERLSMSALAFENRAGGQTGDTVRARLEEAASIGGTPAEQEDRQRRILQETTSQAALTAEGMRGVTHEQLATLSGSETFQARTRRILGADSGDVTGEIEQLEREAETAGGEQGTAMAAVATMLRQEMEDNGGEISEATRTAMRSTGVDQQRTTEIIDARRDMAHFYEETARRVSARVEEGGGSAESRARMGGAATQMRALAGRLRDISQDPNEAARQVRQQLADLDPNSDEYREISEAMGTGEDATALRAAVSQTRQFTRDITGEGRRGRRGAAESALGALTGGTLSDMSFSVMRGRPGHQREQRVTGASSIMQLLQRGGADASRIEAQLTEQLRGMGVSGAEGLVSEFTRDEAHRLETRLEESGVGAAAQRQQAAATEAAQRRSDPLGVQRNDLLTEIRNHIRTMAGAGGDERGEHHSNTP